MAETLKFNTSLNTAAYEAGMAKIEAAGKAAAARMSGTFRGLGSSLLSPIAALAPAIAGAFAGKAIASGVANVFAAGRAVAVLSRQTGASVGGLTILQTKFRQAGLEADMVGRAIFRLQKSIAGVEDDENKGGSGQLRQLGLDMATLQKASPDRQLMMVGTALSGIADETQRNAAAMQIFGKSGAELNAVFGPGFAQVSPALAAKANMMARNAAVFEQVSIKLQKVGGILKTFYVGVADRVATTLLPILGKLENINLVKLGQQFGDGIAHGAQMFLGAFSHPELVASALENGLAAGVLGMGNVLIATLKTGGEFFKDGLLDSLQGIGSAIIATLMESFDKPIRYLQAGIEAALQTAQYLADKASGKKDDDTLAGSMSDSQRVSTVTGLRAKMKQTHDEAARSFDPSTSLYRNVDDKLANDPQYANTYQSYKKSLEDLTNYNPSKYAHTPQTMEEIMAGHATDPTRFGLYGGGQTAEEWRQQAKEQGSAAWQKATAAARGFHVDDVFGAGDYAKRATASGDRLAALGRQALGAGTGSTPQVGQPNSGTLANIRMAAAQSGINTKGMGNDALAALGSSLVFTAPVGLPGSGRTNASDPYTQRVDAQRKRDQFLSHTIGIGGALDFDPSTRPGWTGAKNAITQGGLGGGAYGQTGNIWNQVSGAKTTKQDPVDKIAGHVEGIKTGIDSLVSGLNGSGGGSSGGGGSTPTQ